MSRPEVVSGPQVATAGAVGRGVFPVMDSAAKERLRHHPPTGLAGKDPSVDLLEIPAPIDRVGQVATDLLVSRVRGQVGLLAGITLEVVQEVGVARAADHFVSAPHEHHQRGMYSFGEVFQGNIPVGSHVARKDGKQTLTIEGNIRCRWEIYLAQIREGREQIERRNRNRHPREPISSGGRG